MLSHDESNKKYFTSRQVRERYGDRSHMWLERRLQSDPDFPKPVRIGRLRFWDLDKLVEWERRLAAS
jgi:hypothetical protein